MNDKDHDSVGNGLGIGLCAIALAVLLSSCTHDLAVDQVARRWQDLEAAKVGLVERDVRPGWEVRKEWVEK